MLFCLFLLAGYGIGFVARKQYPVQWMDKNFTTAIKGFSILTVVRAHFGAHLGVGGIQFVAGIGVALFPMSYFYIALIYHSILHSSVNLYMT